MTLQNRFKGSLVGLGVGDALGASVEFLKRDTYEISTYQSGGKLNVKLGEYTDDTAMALCLSWSLLENGFDEKNQLELYLKWLLEAYMSADGRVVDCGKTIYYSLMNYKKNKTITSNQNQKFTAGNGSLMRIAPIALYSHKNIKKALVYSALSSYTTHGLDVCADACMAYTGLIIAALNALEKDEILSYAYAKYIFGLIDDKSLDVKCVLEGSYKHKTRDEISSTGYVIHSLEAALWCFYNSQNFDDGLKLAVNLGNDTDTIGAIYGQLAGAYYGFDAISKDLRENLMRSDFLQDTALRLYEVALEF